MEGSRARARVVMCSKDSTADKLLQYLETSQIGYHSIISSHYGTKQVVYADYTASGKSLQFIEEYIRKEVLPCYGNTHTTTSYTSRQSTQFREEARSIIKKAVHCTEDDALIFAGTGCTGAINTLVQCLVLNKAKNPTPIVFVGPFEHHSNILPWKEARAEMIRLQENEFGEVDMNDLQNKLEHYSKTGRQMIGALSAASNITGVLTDTDAFSILLHRYGALAFWDYATAAPYVHVDMNPTDRELAYKDAVYFSMHKFVGGPDSPGVLIAKKSLLGSEVPHTPGGGTVEYVTQGKHRYHTEPETREEGGTPSIVGAVRAGLAMQLKEAVGSDVIMALEEDLCRHVFCQWEGVEELVIVGPHHIPRLPIFSFLVRHTQSGLFLHHYFVSALLNDLFGIQARGGCSCAGPYGQSILDISEELAMDVVMDSCKTGEECERELTKPGMTRLSFPYFMNQEAVDYIIQAVVMVARDGWKLLPQYTMDPFTGTFTHKRAEFHQQRKHLGSISYSLGYMTYPQTEAHKNRPSFKRTLLEAQTILDRAFEGDGGRQPSLESLSDRVENIRWFLLPSEAWDYGHGRTQPVPSAPITPKTYQQRYRNELPTKPQQNGKAWSVSRMPKEGYKLPTVNRNQSFKLYIMDDELSEEEREASSEEEDNECAGEDDEPPVAAAAAAVAVQRLHTRWVSTVEIRDLQVEETHTRTQRAGANGGLHGPSLSCADLLAEPTEVYRDERKTGKRKKVKNIKKRLKSLLLWSAWKSTT